MVRREVTAGQIAAVMNANLADHCRSERGAFDSAEGDTSSRASWLGASVD
jgi:hypothetical protein